MTTTRTITGRDTHLAGARIRILDVLEGSSWYDARADFIGKEGWLREYDDREIAFRPDQTIAGYPLLGFSQTRFVVKFLQAPTNDPDMNY